MFRRICAFSIVLIAILLTLAAIVLAVGLAFGLMINWLFPSFGLGVSAILGLITLMVMSHILIKLGQFIASTPGLSHMSHQEESDEAYEDEEYEPELLSEEQVEYMVDRVSDAVVARLLAVGHVEHTPSRSKHRSRR